MSKESIQTQILQLVEQYQTLFFGKFRFVCESMCLYGINVS